MFLRQLRFSSVPFLSLILCTGHWPLPVPKCMHDTAAALAGFCHPDANLDISEQKELRLRDHLNHTGMKASLGEGHFLG